jgi:hypothetical protein
MPKIKDQSRIKGQRGATAILAVIIIGAVSLIIVNDLSLSSLNGLDRTNYFEQGSQAMAIADSCLEETMRRLQIDQNYQANNLEMSFGGGSCIINTAIEGNNIDINIKAKIDVFYKSIDAKATINGSSLTLTAWKEISD